VQAVRRLGGVKSQSASQRWKKKQKKEEEPTMVCDSVSRSIRDYSMIINSLYRSSQRERRTNSYWRG
jgi:hypothetical protein